jgi:hypothetical protein
MGIGVGVWLRFREGSAAQEAYGRLAAMARRARVFALEEAAGSRMVLDVKNRSFHAQGLRLLGLWHLEGTDDPARAGVGFAGRTLDISGGLLRDPNTKEPIMGYRGGGVLLPGAGSLRMDDEAFVFPAGGELSCYLRPELDSASANRRQNIFSRGKELLLFINISGELEARSGSVSFSTGYRLPLMRWSLVTFAFGPEELSVAVDGVVRGRISPGDLPAKKEESLPLMLGANDAGAFPFYGTVDEPAIRRVVREAAHRLPENLALESPVSEVRFDAAGMLDRRYHAGPVRMGIRRPQTDAPGGFVTRWVTVTLSGEIREE